MRSAGEQGAQASAADSYSPGAADNKPATLLVAGGRGNPFAASSPAAEAAGGSHMDCDPGIEVIYSGESDTPSDSKRPQSPTVRLETRRLMRLAAVSILNCGMRCSVYSTSPGTRHRDRAYRALIHTMRVYNMRTYVLMTMSMTLRGVIVATAAAIRGIASIVVPSLLMVSRKRSRIVTHYDLLLKTSLGCLT